jgi:hypothetical protein
MDNVTKALRTERGWARTPSPPGRVSRIRKDRGGFRLRLLCARSVPFSGGGAEVRRAPPRHCT